MSGMRDKVSDAPPPSTPRDWVLPKAPRIGSGLRYVFTVGVSLAAAGLYLSPMLRTGFLSDDSISSLTDGMLRYTGEDLATRIVNNIRSSIDDGRFYPLHWILFNAVFVVFRDVYAYKLYIGSLVLVDLALLAAFVRSLTGDRGLACLAVGGTVASIQFRAFHDPILSFFGLLQIVVACVLVSLIATDAALKGRSRVWLAIGAVAFLVAMLTYEVCYPLCALHLLLIAYRKTGWKTRFRAATPVVLAVLICLSATVFVRWRHASRPSDPEGIKPGYVHHVSGDVGRVLATVGRQAASALPLSYALADPAGLFPQVRRPSELPGWAVRPDSATVGLLAAACCVLGFRLLGNEAERPDRRDLAFYALFGTLWAVLPGVSIALSDDHQRIVTVGNGYVPVFAQYFGVGLAAAAFAGYAASHRRGTRSPWAAGAVRLTIAAILAAVTTISFRANQVISVALTTPPGSPGFHATAAAMGGDRHYQRLNLEEALHAGLLEDLPDHATVHLASTYGDWHGPTFSLFFYAMHAEKVLRIVPPSDSPEGAGGAAWHRQMIDALPAPTGPAYTIHDAALGPRVGYILLSIAEAGTDSGNLRDARPIRLFVRHPKLFRERSRAAFLLVGRSSTTGAPVLRPGAALTTVRSGRDWALFALDGQARMVEPGSLSVVFDPRKATALQRLALAGQRDAGDSSVVR